MPWRHAAQCIEKTCQNTRLILATLLKRLTNIITGNQNSGLVREYSSEQPLAGRSLYSWRSHGGKYWRFLAGSLIILQTPRKDKFYAKYVCTKDTTQHGKGNLNKTENTKTTTITAWKFITLGFSFDKNLNSPPPPFWTKIYLVKVPLKCCNVRFAW